MSNEPRGKQLYDRNNDKLKSQDKILEDIITVTDNAKTQNQDMSKEIQRQDVLMKDMKGGMTKIDTRMRRINTKIGSLIESQSFYKLYTIIVLELLILVVLLL